MKHFLLLVCWLSCSLTQAQSQVDSTHYDEVRSLVSFYQYMLNTIGAAKTSTRDKEVIITESYKKVFKDQQVQIEDDLILDRKVITNKDVTAYLRDVDFFFNEIKFDFSEITIDKDEAPDGSFFYLISFESTITGSTIENKSLSSTKKRFIEVNHTVETDDLKIVSVYSTKISREKQLQEWWESLSYGWVDIFKKYVPFDSISNKTLSTMADLDSINLSDNPFILDLEPLSALKKLKQLHISNTKIDDLSPLRYARGLRRLNASQTRISDLATLRYFDQLSSLDLSQTEITEVSELEYMTALTYLNLSNTKVSEFTSIKKLQQLRHISLSNTSFDDPTLLASSVHLETIDLSRTSVDHLYVFQSLPEVRMLNVSETRLVNLNGLENHPNLRELSINQTKIKSLKQLEGIASVKKVYADLSEISEATAASFMAEHSDVVVVSNSEQLAQWWVTLPTNWQEALKVLIGHDNPTKEDLAKLMITDSLNLANKKLYIETPLLKFKRLRYLNVSHNDFVNLDFTAEMPELEYFSCTDVPISSTAKLSTNKNLKQLILSRTKLKDLNSLEQLHKLEQLDVEGTYITQDQVIKYLSFNPHTVVIYQSEALLDWWNQLPPAWQKIFDLSATNTFELHQLIQTQEIEISNQKIQSLIPLQKFIHLKSISLDRLRLTHLNDLFMLERLEQLAYTNGPLQSLESITQLTKLKSLNISNTAIEDLKSLHGLRSLKHLDCSGTGIKNLRGLDELTGLESLNVSNTRIWRLERLYGMKDLTVFVANNTRLSQTKIDAFQEMFPACEITFY